MKDKMTDFSEIETLFINLAESLDEVVKAGPGEEYDYEGYMIRTQLRRMNAQSAELVNIIKDSEQFPSWVQSKVTLASEYMDGVYDFYKYSDYSITGDASVEEPEEDDEDMMEVEESDDDAEEDMMESEEEEETTQVTMGDYTTRHFDICPSAVALYKNISSKTDMIHLVVESLMLHDLLFKIEKQAISMDAADQDMVRKAQHYADMIMGVATEMRLVEDHSYVQGHVDTIKELTDSSSST